VGKTMNYAKRLFQRIMGRTNDYLSWEEYSLRLNMLDDFYFAQNAYDLSFKNIS